MSLGVEQPAWAWAGLALLALAAALLWLARGRSRRWRMSGIILPMAAAIFVSLALAGVSLRRRDSLVIIFLDLSPSTRSAPWRDPQWLRELAAKRLGNDRPVSVEGFGAGNTVILLGNVTPGDWQAWPLAWPTQKLESLNGNGLMNPAAVIRSDLAMPFTRESDGVDAGLSRWVITDGLFASPDPSPAIAWTIVRPSNVDVGVHDVQVRAVGSAENPEVEVMAQVRAVAWPSAGARPALWPETVRATVEVKRDGASIATESIDFHAIDSSAQGKGLSLDAARWVSVHDRPPPAPAGAAMLPLRYEVTVRPEGGPDLWPENDRGSAIWVPPGKLQVLVIGDKQRESLGPAGFVTVEQFAGDAQRLAAEGWQALVLDDVPAVTVAGKTALSPAGAAALERFVRDTGGGLLILGDGHAFGPGRYGEGTAAGDTLESLSPVWSHPHLGEPLRIVFLLDASASMNETVSGAAGVEKKFRVLARGVQQAAGLLTAGDPITVISFNDQARVLVDGPRGATDDAMRRQLAAVEPSHATAPDAALADVAKVLGNDNIQSLVILVTDGEIPAMDVPRWKAVLSKAGVRLCIVAPGSADATRPSALAQLAGAVPGAAWIKSQDAAAWPAILQQAVGDQVRGTLEHAPISWRYEGSGAPNSGTTRSWTRVWAKPDSQVLARGISPDVPLAAVAQNGLGKVAAITMADDGSPAFQAMRAQLLREIAGSAGDRRFRVSADRMPGGVWRISADGMSEAGFLNGESLEARVIAAEGALPVPLAQTGPGHYEAVLPVSGALSAVVARKESKKGVGELVGRVETAAVETAEWPASVDDIFSGIGTLLPAALDDATRWSPPEFGGAALSPFAWSAAVVAALAALWLRR